MVPRRANRSNLINTIFNSELVQTFRRNIPKWNDLITLATDPQKLTIPATMFIILEIFLNILIIEKVPYTEIDWRAYMQEVEGFLNGRFDYSKLRGSTGPLVYPAGFVYIFSLLSYLTSSGENIRLAQYIFAMFHTILLILIFRIYSKTRKVPPAILIFMFATSYRIHSIFVLRLFNDSIAVILFFASLNAFLDDYWYMGSIFYSLAVSVKMNILLFSPALLIAYLKNLGIMKTMLHLFICGAIQIFLGLPFLMVNYVAYLKGAFDLGRIFEYKWTVNWRFLPEDLFLNRYFHVGLLLFHVMTLMVFIPSWLTYFKSYATLKSFQKNIEPQLRRIEKVETTSLSQLFVLPLFTANLIGISFSRSLHYQFYVWYYHTLPYLAWSTDLTNVKRFLILGIIEMCWNTYPSTIYSSAGLHLCHFYLLFNLYKKCIKSTKMS